MGFEKKLFSSTGYFIDTNLQVVSVGPRSEKFNIVSNDHGRTQKSDLVFQLVKPILHTISHLIQQTVLGIQFWSVKCTAPTVRYAKIREHFHSLNVFSTTYTYSNCIVYRLFYH